MYGKGFIFLDPPGILGLGLADSRRFCVLGIEG